MRVTLVMVPVRYPRILAEDEGLDGHRHRVRRHADAAQIDEVEVTQRDAVDHQDLRADAPLFLEERAEGLRDVAIENDVEGFSPFDRTGKAKRDRARECRHALERRRPAPAKRQRDLGIALDDVERLEVAGDGGGESFGLVLAEAFACATPAVASDIPGYAAVATPAAARLVPPSDPDALADAVVDVLSDESRRVEMGRAARAHALANYLWDDIARRLEETYEEAAA